MDQHQIARRRLDARLSPLRESDALTRPPRGWVRAIRDALGMTTGQLAQRLGVSQPRVSDIEKRETHDTITLETLRKTAEALNCTLVYALVPNQPLEQMARERARMIAEAQIARMIPTYITTRSELNEAEQINISDADRWAFARKRDVLDDAFLRGLHRRMLGKVWRWAGSFRQTARNIGVEAYRIDTELRALLDDTRYWIENGTYPPDEIAVRFHHKLVWIHPFPNGNGRHARIAADLLAIRLGQPRFTWGSANLIAPAEARRRYVAALRAADGHDISPLLDFARS